VGIHSNLAQAARVRNIASAYLVPVIDYERDGGGLLIAVGSGLMLAVMDLVPTLRWCVDVGGGRSFVLHEGLLMERNLLHEWLVWMNREVDHVAVAAWFSVTDPRHLKDALRALDPARVVCYGNVDMGRGERASDLDDLRARAARIASLSGTSNSLCIPLAGTGGVIGSGSASSQHQGPTA
jgi:hypothetical protein